MQIKKSELCLAGINPRNQAFARFLAIPQLLAYAQQRKGTILAAWHIRISPIGA
jgi:hypothetical protein